MDLKRHYNVFSSHCIWNMLIMLIKLSMQVHTRFWSRSTEPESLLCWLWVHERRLSMLCSGCVSDLSVMFSQGGLKLPILTIIKIRSALFYINRTEGNVLLIAEFGVNLKPLFISFCGPWQTSSCVIRTHVKLALSLCHLLC